jgi:hypothetical protein
MQSLLSIDEPWNANLDAIQKELDDLQDPAQRRRHRAAHAASDALKFAAASDPLAAMADSQRKLHAWQWHTAGAQRPRAHPRCPPRAARAAPRRAAPSPPRA